MKWKALLCGAVIGGVAWMGITDAATLRNKPASKTPTEAMWDAFDDVVNTDGTFETITGDAITGTTGTFSGKITASLGIVSTAISLTPDDSDGVGVNMITAGITSVDVGAVVNGVTDYIVLPAIASVPVGHTITIVCNAGGAFELRTPAASADEINSEDCDGTKEYLCTDGNIIKVIKISSTIDWMAHEFTPIGAVVTAVVPD